MGVPGGRTGDTQLQTLILTLISSLSHVIGHVQSLRGLLRPPSLTYSDITWTPLAVTSLIIAEWLPFTFNLLSSEHLLYSVLSRVPPAHWKGIYLIHNLGDSLFFIASCVRSPVTKCSVKKEAKTSSHLV